MPHPHSLAGGMVNCGPMAFGTLNCAQQNVGNRAISNVVGCWSSWAVQLEAVTVSETKIATERVLQTI